jgi:hypothetical protein
MNKSKTRKFTAAGSSTNQGQFVRKGTAYGSKFQAETESVKAKTIQENAVYNEQILRQIDKTFVLCIDPGSRLPFMVNMGLKTADTIDLDNRPASQKGGPNQNGSFDAGDQFSPRPQGQDQAVMDFQAILDPENYPCYQKVKRNLYIIEQLLNDENNAKLMGQVGDTILNNEMQQAYSLDGNNADDRRLQQRAQGARQNNKSKNQNRALKSGGGVYFNDSFAHSPIMKWSFKNNPNAEAFRRSMLPFYLLNDDSGWKHPRYVELSNLSQNLSENTSVSITVYLSNDIQDGIDKVLNYINADNNNMN